MGFVRLAGNSFTAAGSSYLGETKARAIARRLGLLCSVTILLLFTFHFILLAFVFYHCLVSFSLFRAKVLRTIRVHEFHIVSSHPYSM